METSVAIGRDGVLNPCELTLAIKQVRIAVLGRNYQAIQQWLTRKLSIRKSMKGNRQKRLDP